MDIDKKEIKDSEIEKPKKKRLSLSAWIMIAMGAGLVVGLFFGEMVGWMEVIGVAFIKLLQMTILPYIIVSLIAGIGKLSFKDAKFLAKKGGIWMLVIWGFGFMIMLGMSFSFPQWITGSYYSPAMVEIPQQINFLDLYIPSNPFSSMAESVIPAVVLFSLAFGIALIGIKEKDGIINSLLICSTALTKISQFIAKLTPVGVFAITASAAGTMQVTELSSLSVYFITFIVSCLFLSFWVIPGLVSVLTPFSYKDVVWYTRGALMLAFTTGNLFVVLPFLISEGKRLLAEKAEDKDQVERYVDIIVPVYFNFPNMGKLILLLFVLFASWFSGKTISVSEFPAFISAGLVSFFGSVDMAIPFLLDLFKIPSDMFNLYMVTGVINGRFATLLGTINILGYTLITAGAMSGLVKVKPTKIVIFMFVTVVLLFAVVAGTSLFMAKNLENPYDLDIKVSNKQMLLKPVPVTINHELPEQAPRRKFDLKKMEEIQQRGVLRVGYRHGNLPWTYLNGLGEIVGFDIEMAHMLAHSMNVSLELVPYDGMDLETLIERGFVDIAMSGITITSRISREYDYSNPYLEVSAAFVVPDYRRSDFESTDTIRKIPFFSIGVSGNGDHIANIEKLFPNAKIIKMESDKDFFTGNNEEMYIPDALFVSAESGAAWTVLYPNYHVAPIKPRIIRRPLGYVMDSDDLDFQNYINGWININKLNGNFQDIYDYWILGIEPDYSVVKRWSIIHDVLAWI
jgi:Na+/H+-dicarboxylate symporter/ABC-type amino acid transport substrate-binding protein